MYFQKEITGPEFSLQDKENAMDLTEFMSCVNEHGALILDFV